MFSDAGSVYFDTGSLPISELYCPEDLRSKRLTQSRTISVTIHYFVWLLYSDRREVRSPEFD